MIRYMSLTFLILTISIGGYGCREDGLNIRVRFDDVRGLKPEHPVIFENKEAGKVKQITYTEKGDYLVDIAIRNEFVNAATDRSQFFIISDPNHKDQNAVEIAHTEIGGRRLMEGETVQGSTKKTLFSFDFMDDFEKGIHAFKNSFEKFADEFKDMPETEEFKALEKEFKDLAEELKRSEKSVRERIQTEVLPELKKELERLRDALKESGRENEIKPLDEELHKMMEI